MAWASELVKLAIVVLQVLRVSVVMPHQGKRGWTPLQAVLLQQGSGTEDAPQMSGRLRHHELQNARLDLWCEGLHASALGQSASQHEIWQSCPLTTGLVCAFVFVSVVVEHQLNGITLLWSQYCSTSWPGSGCG